MFEKYNAVLRGGARNANQVQFMKDKFEKLCKHNRYTTSIHVINSALVKLSKLQPAVEVFRGVKGGLLPDAFWKKNEFNVKGGVEYGFMSTTVARQVAEDYSGAADSNNVSTVMQAQQGMVDRGADLSWVSQYPHEKEICFAPLTSIEVLSTSVQKSALVVSCRFNVSLVSMTIEQVLRKRHKIVEDMCSNVEKDADKTIKNFYLPKSRSKDAAMMYFCRKLKNVIPADPHIFNEIQRHGE
jgi:hypothetical protein